jgi:hypothetical protein
VAAALPGPLAGCGCCPTEMISVTHCCSNTSLCCFAAHLAASSCQVLLHWSSLVQYHKQLAAAPTLCVPALPHILHLLYFPARCWSIGGTSCSTKSSAQMCLEMHYSLLLQYCALLFCRTPCCILLPGAGAAALVEPGAVPQAAGCCCCSAGWCC